MKTPWPVPLATSAAAETQGEAPLEQPLAEHLILHVAHGLLALAPSVHPCAACSLCRRGRLIEGGWRHVPLSLRALDLSAFTWGRQLPAALAARTGLTVSGCF